MRCWPAMPLSNQDLGAIRTVIARDAEAVGRGDWDAVATMFTADAVRFPAHQPPVRGRTAMRAWLATFPPIRAFALTADEIVGAEDVAFVRGSYAIALGGDPAATDHGHYMGVMRRQADGSWLWAADMAVSQLPRP